MRDAPIMLSPGPVTVSPSAWTSIRPLHHRSDEFRRIVLDTERLIRELLETSSPVYTVTASGTGAMEFAVANLTGPGARVLAVSGGKFGDRWSEICRAYGCRVDRYTFPPGERIDVSRVVERIERDRPEILTVTHVESSTGLRLPLDVLSDALTEPRPLVVVDAIASLGVESLPMDRWGLDAVVAASQKAFAAPPGVGFVALSPRATARAQTVDGEKRYYLSLERYEAGRRNGDTPFTPAIHTVQIMHRSLRRMREIGWEGVRNRHRDASRAYIAAARHIGLKSFSAEPSDSVQAFVIPESYRDSDLVSKLAEREGIIVAGGQGPLRGTVLRTGFLGLHRGETLQRAVEGTGRVLADGGCVVDAAAAREALDAYTAREDLYI